MSKATRLAVNFCSDFVSLLAAGLVIFPQKSIYDILVFVGLLSGLGVLAYKFDLYGTQSLKKNFTAKQFTIFANTLLMLQVLALMFFAIVGFVNKTLDPVFGGTLVILFIGATWIRRRLMLTT